MAKRITTIPSYTMEATSDPDIMRFVDRHGNWTHYFLKKEGRYVKAVNHILHLGFNKGQGFVEYLLSVSKEEARKKLETAGEEGSRTHYAIRDLIDGMKVTMNSKYFNELTRRQEILTPEEWDNLVAFQAWCDVYKPQVVSNEFTVASSQHSFAGTSDALLIVTVPSGDKVFPKEVWGKEVLLMPDWKSSSAIRPEYKSQLAAYTVGMDEQGKFKDFREAYKGRFFTGIVRLGTRHKNGGYEMKVWSDLETSRNFLTFIAAMQIAQEHQSEFEPEIRQDPVQFFIKMPKASIKKPKKAKQKELWDSEKTSTKTKAVAHSKATSSSSRKTERTDSE